MASVASLLGQVCYHGGEFFEAIGEEFDDLSRRDKIVPADVLDAWFDPAPEVLEVLRRNLEFLMKTSPPTNCGGLRRKIAEARGLPAESIVCGSGSSDLIFRAFNRWLTKESNVLILSPSYGEYAHVLEHVVQCHVTRIHLRKENNWRVDLTEISQALNSQTYDLVVIVNPNNPTGELIPKSRLLEAIEQTPKLTRFWIDEAYIDYLGPEQSVEPEASSGTRLYVCKTLSKAYALSGARAGYLVGPEAEIANLWRSTPPWVVSLPAQVAAVVSLRNQTYYEQKWKETLAQRTRMAESLADDFDIVINGANWILCSVGNAVEIKRRCRDQNVFVRDVSNLSESFDGKFIRVAARSSDENELSLRAIRQALKSL